MLRGIKRLVSIVYSYKRVGKMNTIASAASEVVPWNSFTIGARRNLVKKKHDDDAIFDCQHGINNSQRHQTLFWNSFTIGARDPIFGISSG